MPLQSQTCVCSLSPPLKLSLSSPKNVIDHAELFTTTLSTRKFHHIDHIYYIWFHCALPIYSSHYQLNVNIDSYKVLTEILERDGCRSRSAQNSPASSLLRLRCGKKKKKILRSCKLSTCSDYDSNQPETHSLVWRKIPLDIYYSAI